jgi:hypothetical protein
MNTALFLSLFALFGNSMSPTTPARRATTAQAVTQVRVATPTTTRIRTTRVRPTAVRVPVRAPRVSVESTRQEPRGTGTFRCTVLENGATGAASYRVMDGSRMVASGRCLSPATSIPAGDYRVIVSLDGMTDRASRDMPLTVRDGRTSTIRAVFETARLTVTVMHDGRRIPGRAVLKKDGRVVASLGSGVYSRVTAGRYEVEISTSYGNVRGSRTVSLDLRPGQVRALNVPF